MDEAGSLYLDLLKRCLMNTIYSDYEVCEFVPSRRYKRLLFRSVLKPLLNRSGAKVVVPYEYDWEKRRNGTDWSPMAHTMIGQNRLDNLQNCIQTVLEENVPGDFLEAGVWRGGATIFMRGMLKAWGNTSRKVWAADSFAGLPAPNEHEYPKDKGDQHHTFRELAISLETVQENFRKYGLLDEQVCFLKGWFKDTLPLAPIKELAILRLDGDMYESTMDGLRHLYPKLSPGGFLIVDDYGAVKACREAVHDYRTNHRIDEEIVTIDWGGVYWQKAVAS
ncbi:MAG: TylF/MycF family methyltransferase [Planctomycetaceae bacterium]